MNDKLDRKAQAMLDTKQIVERYNPETGKHDVSGSFKQPVHGLPANIVKVQLPIAWHGESDPQMMVYNADRSVHMIVSVQERFKSELAAYPHKGFYELLDGSTRLAPKFGKRVGDQSW